MSRKIKYHPSLKLKAVRKMLEGKTSVSQIASSFGIDERQLGMWVRYYAQHGKAGLMPHNNRYTGDFKLKVIKAFRQENLSLTEACLRFHIPVRSVLSNWLRKYDKEGEAGLFKETRGKKINMPRPKLSLKVSKPKTREQELEEQLEYLKLENLYLKKLHALIQQEKEEKNKKLS